MPPDPNKRLTATAASGAWKWQLGVGVSLLAVGIVVSGVGGYYLRNPLVTDPTGCSIMNLAGPCVANPAQFQALLGVGLAATAGGLPFTILGGIHRARSSATADRTNNSPVSTALPIEKAEPVVP